MNTVTKKLIILSLSTISFSVVSTAVLADIYQWRDSSGGIHFGNKPPKQNATVALISKKSSFSRSRKKIALVTSGNSKSNSKFVKSRIFKNSRRKNLLYQGSFTDEESRIISVRLLKESKDKLIFDVNYYLSEDTVGSANIGIAPNMDNWSSLYTKALPGRHATTISVKLSNTMKTTVRSSSLKLTMALAKDTGYIGSIFEHDLSFNKVWYKN